jgi:hypothetical protein
MIQHGAWFINFPHNSKNTNEKQTHILRNSLKNTVSVLTRITKCTLTLSNDSVKREKNPYGNQ